MADLDMGVATPTGTLPTFRTRNLTKVYRTGDVEVHALRGVDLDIGESEIVALLGPSGSGKSTLLNIIGGLDTPSDGEVFFRDLNLTTLGAAGLTRYRRDNVGFVFQFYNRIPSLTARENVELVTELAKNPMRPEEALDLVDLSNRLDHFPAQLSGGEQQRVAIARAVAKRPKVKSGAGSPRSTRWSAASNRSHSPRYRRRASRNSGSILSSTLPIRPTCGARSGTATG